MMTSTFAELVLGLSIPLSIGLFFVIRPLTAILVLALGAEMFLPVGPAFSLSYTPPLSKYNLPYLCALLGCLLTCPWKVARLPRPAWIPTAAVFAIVGGAITGLTNGDLLVFGSAGQVVRPAMTIKDGLFVGISEFLPSWVAFHLGYALVRDEEDVDKVLVALAIAGLLYCLFAIVEMRMSPQFHYWLYGYSTGGFDETIRWGGYRPKVFMAHGLALARFFVATTMALFVLAKRRRLLLSLPVRLLAWLHLVIHILCRSSGAILLALAGILALIAKPKRQALFAALLALVILLYPLLRALQIVPVDGILETAALLGEERRGSLALRFRNEDRLLEHARERIVFGWGTYGRNRVFDVNGEDITVTDGYWTLALGTAGLNGFVIAMGLLLFPVLWVPRRIRTHGTESDRQQLAGLALIIALAGSDLLPNGLWAIYPYLLAGVLMRRLTELPQADFAAALVKRGVAIRQG